MRWLSLLVACFMRVWFVMVSPNSQKPCQLRSVMKWPLDEALNGWGNIREAAQVAIVRDGIHDEFVDGRGCSEHLVIDRLRIYKCIQTRKGHDAGKPQRPWVHVPWRHYEAKNKQCLVEARAAHPGDFKSPIHDRLPQLQ